jgi:hypothetical protein
MRLALETTMERRRKRANQCRWRALSRSSACVSTNIEPADGDELGVGLPTISAIKPRVEALQSAQQALAGGMIMIPALPINQSA